jgi:hypothetical protein
MGKTSPKRGQSYSFLFNPANNKQNIWLCTAHGNYSGTVNTNLAHLIAERLHYCRYKITISTHNIGDVAFGL